MNLRFVSALARRELRARPGRLGLHALSIAIGVAALVAVSSLRAGLQAELADQAQALLGSDLLVSSRRALPEEVLRDLRRDATRLVQETGFRSMLVLPAANATRLVQVRAFDGPFPLYGVLHSEPAAGFPSPGTVLVDDTLLRQFNARVGDVVRLGTATLHSPLTARQWPASSLSKVDLPQPFGPRTATRAGPVRLSVR